MVSHRKNRTYDAWTNKSAECVLVIFREVRCRLCKILHHECLEDSVCAGCQGIRLIILEFGTGIRAELMIVLINICGVARDIL
jgi:hypothetical protein